MSQLSDQIAALTTSVDAAIQRSVDEVDSLNKKIAELQAAVDSGAATPADLQALSTLQQKLDGLDPAQPAAVPNPPPPSNPTETPTPNSTENPTATP